MACGLPLEVGLAEERAMVAEVHEGTLVCACACVRVCASAHVNAGIHMAQKIHWLH